MSEKCDAIDIQILHLRDIARRMLDHRTLDGIDNLIAEPEGKSGATPGVRREPF
jgi:hypothetical protein